jgi:O-antigen/teichoic acid export membrane protein
MLKQFLKDSLIYGLARFFTSSVQFALIPLYTRVFSPVDYGVLDILNVLSTLALAVLALEIAQALVRYMADAATPQERTAYTSTALWFCVAAFTGFVVITWLGAGPISRLLLGVDGQEAIFRAATLAIWGTGIYNLVANQIRFQLRSKLYTALNLVDTLLSIGLTILFVLVFHSGISGVFWGGFIASLVAVAWGLYQSRGSFNWSFDSAKLREMLRFSIPFVPSTIGTLIYLSVDRLTINALMTKADVGLFGIGDRIANIVNLLMFGFQISLTPLIYSHYKEPNTPGQLARLFQYFAAAALLMTTLLSLFAREILAVMTTPQYYAAWPVIPLLVPATILAAMYIFAPGLALAKKTGTFAAINIGGAILNTALNQVFIRLWGIEGAALATLVSSATVFALFMFFSQRNYPVPHHWGRLAVGALGTAALIIIGLPLPSTLPGILMKVGLLAVNAGLFLALRFVDARDVNWIRTTLRRRLRPVPASSE